LESRQIFWSSLPLDGLVLQGMDHLKLAKEAMEASGASGTVEYV